MTISTCPDPTLTTENLGDALKSIKTRDWERVSKVLDIIQSKIDQIRREYRSDAARKEAVMDEYVTNYPLASWDDVSCSLERIMYPHVAQSMTVRYTGKITYITIQCMSYSRPS